MRVLGAAAVALLVLATLLTACAPKIEHPSPAGASFERDDFRFVAPAGWEVRPSTSVSYGPSQILVYVANQALRNDCPTTGSVIICQSPLADGLARGGMLVTWTASYCVANGCELPGGALSSIGNRQGVRVPIDFGCDETGFTERSAYYVTVTPQRVDIFYTCAREPSTTTRAAFLGFLDAIQWRVP